MRANGQEEETAPEKVLAVAARFHQRSHLSFLVLVPMRGVASGVFSLHSRSIAILDFLFLRFGRLDAGKPGKEALAGRKAFECAERGVFVEGFSQDGLPPLLPPPPATLSFESTLVPTLISLLSPPPRPKTSQKTAAPPPSGPAPPPSSSTSTARARPSRRCRPAWTSWPPSSA